MTLPPSTPGPKETIDQPSPITTADDRRMWTQTEGTSFEDIMKEKNRIRKEKEEYHIAELKVQIVRLEDALAAETKRRVEATTNVDDQARKHIYEMEQRLREQLEEDNQKLQGRISHVEERLQGLEERWVQDSTSQMESIEKKASEFGNALEKLQQEQAVERKARLRREGSLLTQVEHHAKEFEDRWTAERREREERLVQLEANLGEKVRKRAQEQTTFQTRVTEELEALRTEIDLEVQERQVQDDEIVGALNRYTQQLQHSLSILSSD